MSKALETFKTAMGWPKDQGLLGPDVDSMLRFAGEHLEEAKREAMNGRAPACKRKIKELIHWAEAALKQING